MKLTGNVVVPDGVFQGCVVFDERGIYAIELIGDECPGGDYILPGFIEMHLHGTGPYTTENVEGIQGMAAYAVTKGTTSFCPTLCCAPQDFYLNILKGVAALKDNLPGAKIAGVYMEGPWVSQRFRGGMHADLIRSLTLAEADELLECGQGLIKVMAIAPEEPGAMEIVKYLSSKGVVMSLAHSDCPPELFPQAVEAGIRQVTHLFDAYDVPVSVHGVRQPALTDMALIDDRVMKEVIVDGKHVPPELIKLAVRAAGVEHILGITDALQGAGMSHCRFQDMGTWYRIEEEGDLARVEGTGGIVGSSLTMNMAFYNLVKKFGFAVHEASRMLSGNQAKVLGLSPVTGTLKVGLQADIAVLDYDCRTVKGCYVGGCEA